MAKAKQTTIEPDILDILAGGLEYGLMGVTITAKLDPKTYKKVDAALQHLGGKWSRKDKCHLFTEYSPHGVRERIEGLVDAGAFVSFRDMEFFPTPEPLVKLMIAEAGIKSGMSVLEPSAGDGRLAWLAGEIVGADYVTVIEKDGRHIAGLVRQFGPNNVINQDFLTIPCPSNNFATFDRIVMNPPFSGQADIDHVRHALNFLSPGGRLVSVMSPGWTFRANKKSVEFKDLVQRYGHYELNPPGTFVVSGTAVNTVLVTIDKK
jgi:predicted RNA methylase